MALLRLMEADLKKGRRRRGALSVLCLTGCEAPELKVAGLCA